MTKLLRAGILYPVITWLDKQGSDVEKYLNQAHIPGDLILSNGWISRFQGFKFFDSIAQSEFCNDVGFHAYTSFQLRDLGPIVQSMQEATTIKDSLDIMCKMFERLYQGQSYCVHQDGRFAWCCCQFHGNQIGQEIAMQAFLMIYTLIIRAHINYSWSPTYVRFQFSTKLNLSTIPGFLGCMPSYGCKYNAIAFPVEYLSRPNQMFKHHRNGVNEPKSESIEMPDENENFSQSFYRLLASRFILDNGSLSIKEAAILIGKSERTIKRRLFNEGVTYRELLDRVRLEHASQMLLEPNTTIKDIAYKMGYAGSNNFNHAFKRMTGMTPTEYRSSEYKK